MTTHRFDVYAAGLVDGEGCITAKSTKSGTGMGIRVVVGMATKAQEVLARLHATYGGTLITQEPKNPQHAKITTWTLNGSEAARFLERVSPHIILKTEQARIAMEIESLRTSQERIGNRDHYRWTPVNLERAQVSAATSCCCPASLWRTRLAISCRRRPRDSRLAVPTTPEPTESDQAANDLITIAARAEKNRGTNWGKYAPAIRRWESLTRPAPAPTEPNRNGRPRLNARFAEWMMGLADGHVTDVPDLSRADQLKAIGNGVCPPQAVAALHQLLAMEAAGA